MNQDSWTNSFFMIWKMNPLILGLVTVLIYIGNHVLFQPMDFHEKVFLLGLAVFFILAAIIYEVFRICRNEEQKEKACRRNGFN